MATVAELVASLGLKWDKGAEARAMSQLNGFAKKAEKPINKLSKFMKSKLAGLAVGVGAVLGTRDALSFSESLARLDITAKQGLGTLDELQSKILGISDATGISKESVLEGGKKFIELTGDVENAAAGMALFAEVAQAAEASTSDVSKAAAAVSQQLGINSDEFRVMFDIIAEGGKEGSVELQGMAAFMADLGSEANVFKGSKGIPFLAKLTAAFQLATREKGGLAGEGKTAFTSLMASLQSPKTKKALAKITDKKILFDAKGNARELFTIIQDIVDLNLNDEQKSSLFGKKEARSAFRGITKVRGELEKATQDAIGRNTIAKDSAKINQNAAIKVSKAWNKMKNAATKFFLVVVDGMAMVVEHSTLFLMVLANVAIAYLVIQRRAIAAALSTALSGIVAAAPWILLGAILIAVAVLFLDFIETLQGKETMLTLFWDKIIESWVDSFADFFMSIEKGFKDFIKQPADLLASLGIIPGRDEARNQRDKVKNVLAKVRADVAVNLDRQRRHSLPGGGVQTNPGSAPGHTFNINVTEAGNAQETTGFVMDGIVKELDKGP